MWGNKSWFKSKGIWAGICVIVFSTYEYVKKMAEIQCGIEGSVCLNLPAIPEFVYILAGTLGIYGRAAAKTTIKLLLIFFVSVSLMGCCSMKYNSKTGDFKYLAFGSRNIDGLDAEAGKDFTLKVNKSKGDLGEVGQVMVSMFQMGMKAAAPAP